MRISRIAHRALLCLLSTSSLLAQAQSGAGSTGTSGSGNATLMSTAGQFSVSPSGAANYRIPIQVPPGVAGMAPKLELVYSSQGGNGILGLGWGISGLSTISRCARTKAQDGVVGGSVNFDANDRFCLDGQRLVLVSGTYGAAGSEYRTEIESFSKITALGTAGSGPASFLVKTKSGLTIEFGNTTDSRIEAVKASGVTSAWTTGTVRAWAQNKVSDVKGNYLTVTYSKDSSNGSYLPSRMDYTGNASSTPVLSPAMSVVFVPGTASRLDAVTGYQAGASYLNPKRIAKIQTYVGAALVKEYRLDYAAQSTALDRSQLSSITECDATGSCLLATSVQWGAKGTDAFAANSTWLSGQFGTAQGWSNSAVYPRQMVDVNGDGLPDIVGFAGGGVYVALNSGTSTGFAAPSYWLSTEFGVSHGWTDNNKFPRYVVDVNGDGLPDIVGFGPSGMRVALNNGSGFDPATTMLSDFSVAQSWADNDTVPRQLADVNGDGLPDVVGFKADGVYVALNTRTGFSAPTAWLTNQFGTNQGWTNSTLNPRQLVDVNGDGLPDIVGFAGTGVTVALNTGAGFSGASIACGVGNTGCVTATMNANVSWGCPAGWAYLNSDSGGELCFANLQVSGGWKATYIALVPTYSCPTGYLQQNIQCYTVRRLADVNGDGLVDIVELTTSGVRVSLNVGGVFKTTAIWGSNEFISTQGFGDESVTPRQLADVNGDGLPDIVGFGPNGVMVSINDGASFKVAVNWNAYFGVNAGGWSDNSTYPRTLADVNGDGVPDVVGFSSSAV
ncbi:MAG: hypothetical protein EBR49_16985, partial [Betaproteobacteria bacterium]|nr:hypothetical protein [Betaproteobacteria bacterium]